MKKLKLWVGMKKNLLKNNSKKTMHKILAIDPSLTQTGWAVISKDHDGTLGFIASNITKTNAKDSLPFRLSEISRAFNKIINIFFTVIYLKRDPKKGLIIPLNKWQLYFVLCIKIYLFFKWFF